MRYSVDTQKELPLHTDASLVTGSIKLNDDYEGGEFLFWREHHVPLKKGQVAAFPSNFMYPHEVRETTKGTRYSFVSWAF